MFYFRQNKEHSETVKPEYEQRQEVADAAQAASAAAKVVTDGAKGAADSANGSAVAALYQAEQAVSAAEILLESPAQSRANAKESLDEKEGIMQDEAAAL